MGLEQAACIGHDPRYWDTTTRNGRTARLGRVKIAGTRVPRMHQITMAKSICASCPVTTSCLAIGMNEEEGIWGGKLPDERRPRYDGIF